MADREYEIRGGFVERDLECSKFSNLKFLMLYSNRQSE